MSQSALKRAMSAEKIFTPYKSDTKNISRIEDYDLGKVIDNNRNGNIIFADTINGNLNEYMDNKVNCIIDALKSESSTFELKPGEDLFNLIERIMGKVDRIIAYEAVGGLRTSVEKAISKIIINALSSYQPEGQKSESDEFDPRELEAITTFWADRKKRTRGGRSAIEFLIAVYGDHGLGRGLNKAHINRHDPKLYMALMNWARDDEKKEELEEYLPSAQAKYLDDNVSQEDLQTFRRVQAIKMRQLRSA